MQASAAGAEASSDLELGVQILEERLSRYPAERYPMQHATAQFHLGMTLANANRLPEAATALERAVSLFEDRLLAEHAQSLNALGAVYRLQQRQPAAADVFRRAAAEFAAAGQSREQAAAIHNLGLVQREMGQHALAGESFRHALNLFDPRERRGRAAASREIGVTLVEAGDLEAAATMLEEAATLADAAGDQAGLGAATNALGVAWLAQGRTAEAIDAFRRSAVANPLSLRRAEYATAKANLALAHAESDDPARARLAAGQALAVAEASDAVRSQASQVLSRVGGGTGALLEVLRNEPLDVWPGVIREELNRWCLLDPAALAGEVGAWIQGQLDDARQADLAEVFIGGLLELRPEDLQAIIRSLLQVLATQPSEVRDGFRGQLVSAMARFHVPQWERLKALFNQAAVDLGQEPAW
jgi:tetratricopeptide (TPR) repeat protein